MIAKLKNRLVERCVAWWRARMPTREAIVVTALLALIFELTYLAAFFVRSELLLKASDANTILRTIGFVVTVKLVVFYWRGFCHKPWRAARFQDLNRLLRSATTVLLVFVAFNYFGGLIPGWEPIPRSVLLLDWMFTLLGVGGMQAVARSVFEEIMPATAVGVQQPVLVIDASPAGRDLVRALGKHRIADYFVAGVLDDDPDRYGMHVGRAKVLGPIAMAPACAERLRVKKIIVREGSIYGSRLRALCDACAAIDVRVFVDNTIVEVFVLGGRAAFTVPVNTPGAAGAAGMSLFATGTGVTATDVNAWAMGPIWTTTEDVLEARVRA